MIYALYLYARERAAELLVDAAAIAHPERVELVVLRERAS